MRRSKLKHLIDSIKVDTLRLDARTLKFKYNIDRALLDEIRRESIGDESFRFILRRLSEIYRLPIDAPVNRNDIFVASDKVSTLLNLIRAGRRDGVYIDFVNNLAYVKDSVTPANNYSGTASELLSQNYTPTVNGAVIDGDTEGFILPRAIHNWSGTTGTYIVDHVGTNETQTNKRLLDHSTDLVMRAFVLPTIDNVGSGYRFGSIYPEQHVSMDLRNILAMSYGSNGTHWSLNGNPAKSSPFQPNFPLDDLGIGRRPSDTSSLFEGSIRSVVYVPEQIDDSTLERESTQGTYTYDVFLIAGQSNAVGRAVYGVSSGDYHVSARQFTQEGVIAMPTVGSLLDLDHIDDGRNGGLDSFGFALRFSQSYLYSKTDPLKRILLIPCATGGTSFSRNNWNRGDAQYQYAVEQTNKALKLPNTTLKGLLWHQGETDAVDAASSVYATNLDAALTGFRKDIMDGVSMPIVVGGLRPAWVTNEGAEAIAVQAIIEDTPNRISNCAYSSSASFTGGAVDDPHFSIDSTLEMGERYFAAYESI